MKNLKQKIIILGLALMFLIPAGLVLADTTDDLITVNSSDNSQTQVITADQINNGAAFNFFGGNLGLILSVPIVATSSPAPISTSTIATSTLATSIIPVASSTVINLEVSQVNETMSYPWQLTKLSQVYQFNFQPSLNQAAPGEKITLHVAYNECLKNQEYKQIFFWDDNSQAWKPLASTDNQKQKYLEAQTTLSAGRIAVFSFPGVITTGQASWYKFKGGNFAASPDFPIGSRVRVFNTDNNKFVDVTINDWGPERALFPNRVIDLDKVAFLKIAPAGSGLSNIRIQPLEIKADNAGRVLDIPVSGAPVNPKITATAAIVIRESDGQVIWEKNSAKVLPLASLTKIVAIKTFLDIGKNRQRLKELVTYGYKDEKYNYKSHKVFDKL